MGRISRAFLLLRAGHPDEAEVQLRQAGPPEAWSWPVFFTAPGSVLAALVAIDLGRADELRTALAALEAFRGEHVVGTGVSYCGPAELTLGLRAARPRPARQRCRRPRERGPALPTPPERRRSSLKPPTTSPPR